MTGPSRWVIRDYRTAADERPIRTFLESLGRRDLADALALVKLAEERGNALREPHSKALGDGLYELRGKQVRVFYVFGPERGVITLLSGMIKKQDRIPEAALEQARRFRADVVSRARGAKRP